ncbi:MAG: rhodanese-like domain-containing protein [Balneolaceae bacterium]|nr:rhodanese-like domain-containing protein [Balneolaceae bacterium]
METATFELVNKKKEDPQYEILDVRKASEYKEGHVEGALTVLRRLV